jgi:predicted nucleic acid-binding protein
VTTETHPERFALIEDPNDLKFAALAAAAGAILVSNDDHLLSQRDRLEIEVLTPAELMARYGQG